MSYFLSLLIEFFILTTPSDETDSLKKAPDFILRDFDGVRWELKENLEKCPIIINFWAAYCKPCKKELTAFQKLYEKYEKKFEVVAICVDTRKNLFRAKKVVLDKKLKFIMLWDKECKVMREFQVSVLPTTFILDKDGNIVFSQSGYKKKYDKIIEEKILELIKEDIETKPNLEGD